MMALFVGVVALGFGFVFTQNAGREMDARTLHIEGYTMVVIAPAAEEQNIKHALGDAKTAVLSQTPVKAIHGTGDAAGKFVQADLIGATEPYNYKVWGAPWGQPDGVYIYDPSPIATGSEIEIVFADDTIKTLPVIGRYAVQQTPTTMWTSFGPLMPLEASRKIVAPETLRVYAEADANKIAAVSTTLHGVTVIDLAAYAARFTQAYYNLFVLAVAMAGLALLAGLLLIANAVSLAMVDRQYEIGVLKTIGYTRRHLWLMFAVEYGLVALIASAAGVAVVQAALFVIGLANGLAARLLTMNLGDVGIIVAATLLLTLGTVLAVSWEPMRRSPVFILNDRA
jgi:putative ABC transport system permease protein